METNTEMKICQICGMPMQEDQYGTNQDKSKNDMYCCYCYKDGTFTQDFMMEQMADYCAPFEVEDGRSKTIEKAKVGLMQYFATLHVGKCKPQICRNKSHIMP